MDIFYEKLKKDISDFYDEFFCKEESLKEVHLYLLNEHYDKKRFQDCDNLELERIKFLTELQKLVETQSCWYG